LEDLEVMVDTPEMGQQVLLDLVERVVEIWVKMVEEMEVLQATI
jgi:hypothetical protein